jgi:hypothetical protein
LFFTVFIIVLMLNLASKVFLYMMALIFM